MILQYRVIRLLLDIMKSDYYEEEEVPEDFVINVLDVDVFNEAIKSFILAFVSLNDYNDFLNGEVEELN